MTARLRPGALAACAGIMVATLLTVLGLNIALSRGSYTADRLAGRQEKLQQQEQALTESIRASAAPEALASAARSLGMVPDLHPGYLRASDGAVLVSPSPAPPTATGP